MTDTETPTAPDPAINDTPILHRSGAVQFHLDGRLVTLRPPKIGQLRVLKQKHSDAAAEVRAIVEQGSAEIDETRAELQRVRDALDTDDNEQAAQAAAQVQRDAAHFMAQITRLTEETRDRQFEESARLAALWFVEALAMLGDAEQIPAPDDLPGWMAQLGSVRQMVEHWMTHPSPRGV